METILNFMSSVFCLVTTILTWNNVKKSRAIINRQKAENEKLKKESNEWKRCFINRCRDFELEVQENEKLKAEVERLKARNDELNALNKTASIEAIKAFAEEVVLNLPLTPLTEAYIRVNVSEYLKEMEGDEK